MATNMNDQEMDEITAVPHADDMSNEIFAKHMTLRHRQSLGGLPDLTVLPNVLPAWRAFHRNLHRHAVPGQLNHVHKPKKAA